MLDIQYLAGSHYITITYVTASQPSNTKTRKLTHEP